MEEPSFLSRTHPRIGRRVCPSRFEPPDMQEAMWNLAPGRQLFEQLCMILTRVRTHSITPIRVTFEAGSREYGGHGGHARLELDRFQDGS